MTPPGPLLAVEALQTYYGPSHVLFGVSLLAHRGEVVALLGRNGAGKSTTLRSIMGLTPPRSGRVTLDGQDITGWPPHRACRAGLGFVPEDRRIFGDLTVAENLEVGRRPGPWTVGAVVEFFPVLGDRWRQKGGTLSGGEQQMLTIARTLMGNPTLLLLDEPSEGLAPVVVRTLLERLLSLKARGQTIFCRSRIWPWPPAWPTGRTSCRRVTYAMRVRWRRFWPTRPYAAPTSWCSRGGVPHGVAAVAYLDRAFAAIYDRGAMRSAPKRARS